MIKQKIQLEVNTFYSVDYIFGMRMKQIESNKERYLMFQKDFQLYFFEIINDKLLRLIYSTCKKSNGNK